MGANLIEHSAEWQDKKDLIPLLLYFLNLLWEKQWECILNLISFCGAIMSCSHPLFVSCNRPLKLYSPKWPFVVIISGQQFCTTPSRRMSMGCDRHQRVLSNISYIIFDFLWPERLEKNTMCSRTDRTHCGVIQETMKRGYIKYEWFGERVFAWKESLVVFLCDVISIKM